MRATSLFVVCAVFCGTAVNGLLGPGRLAGGQLRQGSGRVVGAVGLGSRAAAPRLMARGAFGADDVSEMQGEELGLAQDTMTSQSIANLGGVLLSVLLLPTQDAWAGGAEYGILAGRTASMLHPVTMFLLFATSLYSGYLGLQWRRLRGLSDEIKELQQQAPRLSTGLATFPLSASIQAVSDKLKSAEAAEQAALTRDLDLLRGAASLDAQIEQLKATRSSLQKADLKDKHQTTGSVLLGVGVSVSLLGAFNTYMRAGKLFPGPHLYAGMGCTALWAVAAALVPEMQKGNEAARKAHIGLNAGGSPCCRSLLPGCPVAALACSYSHLPHSLPSLPPSLPLPLPAPAVNVALFAWQVVSGVDIMVKVWEKTSWP